MRPVASTPAVPALPAFWCKLEVWVLPLQLVVEELDITCVSGRLANAGRTLW